MKTCINIVKIFVVFLLIQCINAQKVDVNINFLNSADYTYSAWNNNRVNIFDVELVNTTSESLPFYIDIKLDWNGEEGLSGKSKSDILLAGETKIYNHSQLIGPDAVNAMFSGQAQGWDSNLFEQIYDLGYLPSGEYILNIDVFRSDDDTTKIGSEVHTFTKVELDKSIVIETEPTEYLDYINPYSATLKWSHNLDYSDFSDRLRIGYRLKVALYKGEEIHTPTEALEDESYIIYDNDWQKLTFAYFQWPIQLVDREYFLPFNQVTSYEGRDLQPDAFLCGHQYVYQIEAREYDCESASFSIDDCEPEGIWGWDYPVKSIIGSFRYGDKPILNDMVNSDQYPDVLPLFEWSEDPSIPACTNHPGYEIEITSTDGESFFKLIESAPSSEALQYPSSEEGLVPGKKYKWRIRLNSAEKNNSMWTSNFKEFSLQNIKLESPIGNSIVDDVFPAFEIIGPQNISYYSMLIGDENDESVDNVEIYNAIDEITTFPGKWDYPKQNITEELYPGQTYYWKLKIEDENGTPISHLASEDSEAIEKFNIRKINLMEPSNAEESILLNQTFTWLGPNNVPGYEFLLSDSEDKEIENEKFSIDIDTSPSGPQTYTYQYDGEFPLEYEKIYYWKVIPLNSDGGEGPRSSHSEIWEFKTLDFPKIGESVESSTIDSRIPIIKIDKSNFSSSDDIDFSIIIYSDIGGSNIVEEIIGISLSSFPYIYSVGPEVLEFGLTYYIQIIPTKGGENYGTPSTIIPFIIPEQTDDQLQCLISCEFVPNEEPEILTSVLNDLEDASEYLVLFSENEDMSSPFTQIIESGETQIRISDNLDWGKTYYTQVIALNSDGDEFGIPSEITSVDVEEKPGMNEQTAMEVELVVGSTNPVFKIINDITGANGYRITVSTEPDMSVVHSQIIAINTTEIKYSRSEKPLDFGKSYFVTAQGLDGEIPHGIESSIVGFFIANITPPKPIIGDLFKWEASIPPADKYLLEVSLLEDFSVLVFEKTIETNFYNLKMSELEYNKHYYWRIQPLNSESNMFGSPSSISFFKSEAPPKPVLNIATSEVSTLPSFSWSGIDIASEYQISVSENPEMEDFIWQINITNTSVSYPESAKLLTFSTKYYWKVIALGENKNILSFSDIASFLTKSTYPVLGLVPDGGIETFSPTLEWKSNDKVALYRILVANNIEMNPFIIDQESSTNSFSVEFGILESGKKYYWIVDGLNENGESLAGPSNTALILMPSENNIPLISPIGAEKLNTLTPLFKWGSLVGTNTYKLEISTDSDFANIIFTSQVSGNENILSDENKLNNSTNYFWRVEGINENDIIISSIESFITPDISELVIQTLEDGEVISLTNPTFTWQSASEISSFAFRISDNIEFSESSNYVTGASSFKYPSSEPELQFDISYYWQISPLNKEGNQIGDWTAVRQFSINAASIVDLELPENESIETTSNPNFEWNKIEIASKYEIQVSSSIDFSEMLWSSDEIIENSTLYPSSGGEQLVYDKNYYWRVRALGESAPLGDFSTPFSFKISGDYKVQLEGPLKESESLLPYFSWEAINGAESYRLTVGSDESLSTIIYTVESKEVFQQYLKSDPPLNFKTSVYWQVIALDENGDSIGDPSSTGKFDTPNGAIVIEFIFGTQK